VGIEQLEPEKVLFFCAMLGASEEHLIEAEMRMAEDLELKEMLGADLALDRLGPRRALFEGTSYYEKEVGKKPWRGFVCMGALAAREILPEIKNWSNQRELSWFGGRRLVNLDPGYLTLGQVFLATTKDQRHRVYLRDGIFAEVSLYFEGKGLGVFPWTYPDYHQERYAQFFLDARRELRKLRTAGSPTQGR
jgi:hypothetical protein